MLLFIALRNDHLKGGGEERREGERREGERREGEEKRRERRRESRRKVVGKNELMSRSI